MPGPSPPQAIICINKDFFTARALSRLYLTPGSSEIQVSLMKRRDFCPQEHYKN